MESSRTKRFGNNALNQLTICPRLYSPDSILFNMIKDSEPMIVKTINPGTNTNITIAIIVRREASEGLYFCCTR